MAVRKNPDEPTGTAIERVVTYYRTPRFRKGREWLERELGQMRLFEYNPAQVKVLKIKDKWAVLINSQVLKQFGNKTAATKYAQGLKARASKMRKNPAENEIAAEVAEEFLDIFDVDDDGELDREDVQLLKDFDETESYFDEPILVTDVENEITGEIITETIDGDVVIDWADGMTTVEDKDELVLANGLKSWNLRRKAARQYRRGLKFEEQARKARHRQSELESDLRKNPEDLEFDVYTFHNSLGKLDINIAAVDGEKSHQPVEILFTGSIEDAKSFFNNELTYFSYKYYSERKENPIRKTRKVNPSGWFAGCTTAEEVKERYKELAKQHHPDKGGDLRTMQDINGEYGNAIKFAAQNETNDFRRDNETAAAEPLREAIEFAVTLPDDVIVTIRGLWLWLEGNTYYSKDKIKSFVSADGQFFKFASKKKAWFFAAVPSKNKGSEMSFEDIEARYGKQVVSDRKEIRHLNPGIITGLAELAVGAAAALEIRDKLKTKKRKLAKSAPMKKQTSTKKRLKRNPDSFAEFQGRESTKTLSLIRPRLAPAKLWCLGKLIEIKLVGSGEPYVFEREVSGKTFYLCADEGNKQLWIAGAKMATADKSLQNGFLEPLGEIRFVVYGTQKTHLGDEDEKKYIHFLGEEGGARPVLALDNEGFAHIQGGDYTITPLGIKD